MKQIYNINEIIGKTIKNACYDTYKVFIIFTDDSFIQIDAQEYYLEFDNEFDQNIITGDPRLLRKLKFISEKEYDEYIKEKDKKDKVKLKQWDIDTIKRIKSKYTEEELIQMLK